MPEKRRRPMTTGGWLAAEKDFEEAAKTDPLAALESLPRARWWAWLRAKLAKLWKK